MTRILKLRRKSMEELQEIANAAMRAEIERERLAEEQKRLAEEQKKALRAYERKLRHQEIDREYQRQKRARIAKAKRAAEIVGASLEGVKKNSLADIRNRILAHVGNGRDHRVFYHRLQSGQTF